MTTIATQPIGLKVPCPAPGVYRNVVEGDYRAWDAMNISTLEHAERSMEHLRDFMEAPPEPANEAQNVGVALHMAVLEPDRYARLVVTAPEVDRRTKDGKAEWAAFLEESEGKLILSRDEYQNVGAMQASILRHPLARRMALAAGQCEAAVVWDDALTGVRCKGKLDKFVARKLALDIKTTRNASLLAFRRDIYNFNYHVKVAFYSDGFKAATGDDTPFALLAVENVRPFSVAVYTIDDASLQVGRETYRRWLHQYAECRRSGVWPGYGDQVVSNGIPTWALRLHSSSSEEVAGE